MIGFYKDITEHLLKNTLPENVDSSGHLFILKSNFIHDPWFINKYSSFCLFQSKNFEMTFLCELFL